MSENLSLKKRKSIGRALAAALAAIVLFSLTACSAPEAPEVSLTPSPSPSAVRTFAPPSETPTTETSPGESPGESPDESPDVSSDTSPDVSSDVSPDESPDVSSDVSSSPTASSTAKPTPEIEFPAFKVDSSGNYIIPQVVASKTSAKTNEPIYFKIVTSDKVKSVQTYLDGKGLSVYTKYETDSNYRIWQTKVICTKSGSRKVQFKCALTSGGTVYVPKTPMKISITFNYTAESTSKTISKGKTVVFTLKTPDTIDKITPYVDGVKQQDFKEPDSKEDGVAIWKIRITFFGLGTRAVTFKAYDGSKLKKTFPDPGIPIIVQASA